MYSKYLNEFGSDSISEKKRYIIIDSNKYQVISVPYSNPLIKSYAQIYHDVVVVDGNIYPVEMDLNLKYLCKEIYVVKIGEKTYPVKTEKPSNKSTYNLSPIFDF